MSGHATGPLPLWAGRTLAFVGIMFVAFNVRTAVASIAPIVDDIIVELPLSSIELGIIGTIPPIAFAFSALFGAAIARRLGLERLLALAIVAMIIGHVLRASAGSFLVLLAGTMVALAGAGIGNVLLPPLVKRYFADRVGLVTAIYVAIVSVSAAVPSAIASPVTDAAGWRFSLGLWAIVALVCLLPWIGILLRHRRERARAKADGDVIAEAPHDLGVRRVIWRSRVAWALAIIFSLSSSTVYSAFAWLPLMASDLAGVGPAEGGVMVGAFALVGVPLALIAPILAARVRNVGFLVYVGIAFCLIGFTGMLLAPTPLIWLWVLIMGSGPILFPLSLVLINLRTRTHEGSVALSGFVQGVGYLLAAAGPFFFALLHDVTGGWQWPLIFMIAISIVAAIAGAPLRRAVYIEDELGLTNAEAAPR